MANGVEKLGGLLRSQMHEVSKYNIGGRSSVLGEIKAGKGLKIDGVDYTIPKGDYLVCRSCSGSLAVGNRVLVNICGNEPVVVDIIA